MHATLLQSQATPGVLAKVRRQLLFAKRHLPMYRQKLQDFMVKDFGWGTFLRIPFTTPDEVRRRSDRFLADGSLNRVDIVLNSSGTTGRPKFTFHKFELSKTEGLSRRDVVLVMHRWGNPLNALAASRWRTSGVSVIQAPMQIEAELFGRLLQERRVTVIRTVSSTILSLTEELRQAGFPFRRLRSLRQIVLSGAGLTEPARRYLTKIWGVPVVLRYSCNEVTGIAGECMYQNGLHPRSSDVLVELVDPTSHRPVAEGEIGEIVLTNLRSDPMIVLRYRVGDLGFFRSEPCPCGRSGPRLWVIGRKDDMMTVGRKGTRIFPNEVATILARHPECTGRFQLHVASAARLERLTCEVELWQKQRPTMKLQSVLQRELEHTNRDVREDVAEGLLKVGCRFVPFNAFPVTDAGKPRSVVVDHR